MTSGKKDEYREPGTGRYAYWNKFNRMCKCGHRLGVHIAGGFECGEKGCACEKFKPDRKKVESSDGEIGSESKKRGELVPCPKCDKPTPFGSCCDECDEPTDH